jgi:hypothetical protein
MPLQIPADMKAVSGTINYGSSKYPLDLSQIATLPQPKKGDSLEQVVQKIEELLFKWTKYHLKVDAVSMHFASGLQLAGDGWDVNYHPL